MKTAPHQPPASAPSPVLPPRPILVVGASGAIGSQVVRALVARGARVRVLIRSLDRVADLPPQVERAVGALEDRRPSPGPCAASTRPFTSRPTTRARRQLAENFVLRCELRTCVWSFPGSTRTGRTDFPA